MAFKEGEQQEKAALQRLRQLNLAKPDVDSTNKDVKKEQRWSDSMDTDTSLPLEKVPHQNGGTSPSHKGSQSVCVCGDQPNSLLHRCHLCRDWFHGGCVPFPSLLGPSDVPLVNPLCWWDWDTRFLCLRCQRTRRPRLETILALLVALQKLPVRLPEGEALQCLTERAINWQERAKQVLDTPEVQKALERLQELKTNLSREKTEQREKKGNVEDVIVLSDSEEQDDGVIDLTEESNSKKSNGGNAANGIQSGCENSIENVTGVESLAPLVPQLKGCVIELAPSTRAQLEELQLEGDLLEVTLDQTQTIYRLLQAASLPPHQALHTLIQIELQEQTRSGHGSRTKDSKRKRKGQKEGGAKCTEPSESKKTRPVNHMPVQLEQEVL